MRCALLFGAVVLSSLLAGCEGGSVAPPFPAGQGQAPGSGTRYPGGPFGNEIGSVVQNYKFLGFPDPAADKGTALEISLADFYNPTGSEVYEEGSFYGEGNPKPKALLINISAVWCGPCQFENAEILPEEHAQYSPRGAQFLLLLADGPNQGEPAAFNHLVSWTKKYKTAWPAVIDPSYKLSALFEATAFPINILIDTRTMEISDIVSGVPEPNSTFFVNLESLLEED